MPRPLKIKVGGLFAPITFEVDGVEYSAPPLTVDLIEKMDAYDKRFAGSDRHPPEMSALLDEVVLLGVPEDVARRMDFRELAKIVGHVRESITDTDHLKREPEAEKNG